MAHEDHRAVELADGFFQHVLGAHVEVVGRFVENQQIDGLEQELYHGEATALAAAEHLDLLVGGFAAKHERAEDVADFQAHVAHGHAVDGIKHGEALV